MSVLGTESSPLDAAVKTVMSLVSVSTSSCQIAWRRLYSFVAAFAARFAFRSDSQLMWVRVVTGSDIVLLGQEKTRRLLCGLFLFSPMALREKVTIKDIHNELIAKNEIAPLRLMCALRTQTWKPRI